MLRYFTLEYWKDEGWYIGRLKEVPGLFSQGRSLKELQDNIRESYYLVLEEGSLPSDNLQTRQIEIGIEIGAASPSTPSKQKRTGFRHHVNAYSL